MIHVPSLRERFEDLPELAAHLLNTHSILGKTRKRSLSEEALNLLTAYSWPGNVRELQQVLERAANRSELGLIRPHHMIEAEPRLGRLAGTPGKKAVFRGVPGLGPYSQQVLQNEQRKFKEAVIAAAGSRNEAAKSLGISRATFFRKARELGLVKGRGI